MRSIPLLLLLATGLALAGCTTQADDAPEPDGNATADDDNSSSMMAAKAVAVSLVDRQVPGGVAVPPATMGIQPSTLELMAGERVNLTVTNDGNTGHDLVIEGLDVATESIAPGESVSVEFTPTEAGTFRMYCSVGGDGPMGHASQGMQGEVVVS